MSRGGVRLEAGTTRVSGDHKTAWEEAIGQVGEAATIQKSDARSGKAVLSTDRPVVSTRQKHPCAEERTRNVPARSVYRSSRRGQGRLPLRRGTYSWWFASRFSAKKNHGEKNRRTELGAALASTSPCRGSARRRDGCRGRHPSEASPGWCRTSERGRMKVEHASGRARQWAPAKEAEMNAWNAWTPKHTHTKKEGCL